MTCLSSYMYAFFSSCLVFCLGRYPENYCMSTCIVGASKRRLIVLIQGIPIDHDRPKSTEKQSHDDARYEPGTTRAPPGWFLFTARPLCVDDQLRHHHPMSSSKKGQVNPPSSHEFLQKGASQSTIIPWVLQKKARVNPLL